MEQDELSTAVHMAFDKLELGDLALGLSVRQSGDDCGPDGSDITGDTVGKRGDQTAAGLVDSAVWTCNGFEPVLDLTMPPWLRMRAG